MTFNLGKWPHAVKTFWFYRDWGKRWPSIGCDEYNLHTVVIPWPFGHQDAEYPDDPEPVYRAVVIGTPWECGTRHG